MPWFEELRYIRGFGQCSKDMVSEVGGKVASLGELSQAGFNIPPGFAITAYPQFAQQFGIQERVAGLLSSASSDGLEEVSRKARGFIESLPLPKDIEEEIEVAFKTFSEHLRSLGESEPLFAVRSSATAEDQPNASFAGQFDTSLGIKTAEALKEAVKKCWSSLFTSRAIAYRNLRGLSLDNFSMCVGVQKMVKARSSGVLFTVNPATGNRAQILINANWGLGESVVRGMASVDSFTVNKVTLQMTKKEVGIKQIQSLTQEIEGETFIAEVPPELRRIPCLADEEVQELAKQAKLIEEFYRRPQDIEFAIDGSLELPERVFILQSRPETHWSLETKSILRSKGHIADHLVSWFRGASGEE